MPEIAPSNVAALLAISVSVLAPSTTVALLVPLQAPLHDQKLLRLLTVSLPLACEMSSPAGTPPG